jgi:hypothetical protein
MSYYNCERCLYKSDKYANIVRHITKKIICKRIPESYKYSDDQILILTILPKYENNVIIKDEDLNKYEKSSILYKNKEELLNIIKDVNKNGAKNCKFCNKTFTKTDDVKRHIVIDCFIKEINKKNINLSNHSNNINNSNNITNSNINNNNNNNNITNNFNVSLELKPPLSFYDDWDLSEFSKDKRLHYLFQKSVYTTFLEKILENKNNLNVIIEDINQETALIYKNDTDKYKEIKVEEIVSKTMEKLKENLLMMTQQCLDEKYDFQEDLLNCNVSKIKKKYTDYKYNNNIKKYVDESISGIYKKNKDDAIDTYTKIMKDTDFEKNGY